MAQAICISCGRPKPLPWKICRSCRFDPTKDDTSLAKSVYLSTGRFSENDEKEQYARQLDDLGQRIANGESIEYEHGELNRLRAQKVYFESVPMRVVWGAVGRLFLPGIVFLLILVVVWFLLRYTVHVVHRFH